MRYVTLFAIAWLSGCGDPCEEVLTPVSGGVGDDAVFEEYDSSTCTPSQEVWDESVLPVVVEKCGSCHGEEPAFGAPISLVDYEEITAGIPEERYVDRIARRAAQNTMPPPSSPALEHEELDLLVEWATCGEVHPDHSIGLEVDRELYTVEVPENAELPSFDVAASEFAIGKETLDLYQCFALEVPIDEERFVKRMQVVLDDARVLHHIVLMHDPKALSDTYDNFKCFDWPIDDTQQLWAWAPGTGAFDFEEGGLKIKPGDRLVVQIHYNNGAGLQGVRDSSGVRIFHGPAEGRSWVLHDPGPTNFRLEGGEQAVCSTEKIYEPMRILAGMPHMHAIGAELHSWIERKGGIDEDLVNLTGWNFEAQRYYQMDTKVEKGDKIRTWCGYRNYTGYPVRYGARTEDEMCFNFMFTSPL